MNEDRNPFAKFCDEFLDGDGDIVRGNWISSFKPTHKKTGQAAERHRTTCVEEENGDGLIPLKCKS